VPQLTKNYGSVILSRGQLSSISAQVNHRANDIIAIEHISTASGEGWKYADGKGAEDQNWNCAGCGTFNKNAFYFYIIYHYLRPRRF
jgi:hypothetical protein